MALYRTRLDATLRPRAGTAARVLGSLLAGAAFSLVAGCGTFHLPGWGRDRADVPPQASAPAPAGDDGAADLDGGVALSPELAAWLADRPELAELEEIYREAVALTARSLHDPAEDLLLELKDKLSETPLPSDADSLTVNYRQSLDRRVILLAGLLAEERAVSGRSAPADSLLERAYADIKGLVLPDTLAPIPQEARSAIETNLLAIDNALVQEWLAYFIGAGRDFFTRWLERKAQTDSLVIAILTEAGLPAELYYMSMIESGLNSHARSRVGAIGYWQFMPGTARHFRLRRDWWVDERRDLEMSTRAAAAYLSQLYNHFQDWALVLAAYNAGEGRIDRIIKRAGHRDFWRLPLPSETRNHIPKFIATARICADPARYGFASPPPNPLRYDVVNVDRPTDLDVVARCAGVAKEEVRALNPALLRGVSPPDSRGYPVRVPLGRGAACAKALAGLPDSERIAWQHHTVRKGETVGGIAARYGVTAAMLRETNKIPKSNLIHPGDQLLIPMGGGLTPPQPRSSGSRSAAAAAAPAAASRDYTPPAGYERIHYDVRRGDTLSSIARRLGVTLDHLRLVNNLKRTSLIRPGQRLFAWRPS